MTAVNAVQNHSPAATNDGGRGYIVKSGDTLSGIAASHGVSLVALESANPHILHPDLIRPGQHVSIPSGDVAPASYTVQRGDTLSGIAARNGLDTTALARTNHIADPDRIAVGRTLSLHGAGAVGSRATSAAPAARSAPATSTPTSSNAAAVAEKYLGQNASSLKVNRNDKLPMDANVPSDVCCANFVSAVLTEAGQLPARMHTDSVAQLNTTLRGQGWTPVSASNARPGDVVIIQSHGISHTVMVSGPGQYIGSNNRNADGSQRISHGNLSWATNNGGVILRAPASVTTGAPGAQGAAPSTNAGPAAASHQGRIDQAITYFQSHGWTRNQAIGIVANLDAESNMEAGIRQHGGGPGYGLGQWEGPRQAGFAAWAGHSIQGSTFAEQLGYVQHELTTSEAGAGRALHGATGAGEAASIVTRLYERPADSVGEASRRAVRAESIAGR